MEFFLNISQNGIVQFIAMAMVFLPTIAFALVRTGLFGVSCVISLIGFFQFTNDWYMLYCLTPLFVCWVGLAVLLMDFFLVFILGFAIKEYTGDWDASGIFQKVISSFLLISLSVILTMGSYGYLKDKHEKMLIEHKKYSEIQQSKQQESSTTKNEIIVK